MRSLLTPLRPPFAAGLLLFAAVVAAQSVGEFPPFPLHPHGPPGLSEQVNETISPGDIDGDGDMDFFSSGGGRSHWCENIGGGNWKRYALSDSFYTDVGAVAVDVDGDGRLDRVSGTFWHRNRATPTGPAFDPYRLRPEDAGDGYVHDQLAADVDGDGRPDIIDIEWDAIRWFRNPVDPKGLWSENFINRGTGEDECPQHGGLAAGDIDGDGDIDVSRVNIWYENLDGRGGAWSTHDGLDFGKCWDAGWGISSRALLVDLDLDGSLDLVQGECDDPNGRLAIFFNQDGKGGAWLRHMLKDSTDGQDFHSLVAADFDDDGDLDLFSMGGPNSASPPKAYIWENLDGKGGAWHEHVVATGMEGHDNAALDYDGDGDLDIIGKAWREGTHYWLENTRLSRPQAVHSGGKAGGRMQGKVAIFPVFRVHLEDAPRDLRGRLLE